MAEWSARRDSQFRGPWFAHYLNLFHDVGSAMFVSSQLVLVPSATRIRSTGFICFSFVRGKQKALLCFCVCV